jgi:hypothetical protein
LPGAGGDVRAGVFGGLCLVGQGSRPPAGFQVSGTPGRPPLTRSRSPPPRARSRPGGQRPRQAQRARRTPRRSPPGFGRQRGHDGHCRAVVRRRGTGRGSGVRRGVGRASGRVGGGGAGACHCRDSVSFPPGNSTGIFGDTMTPSRLFRDSQRPSVSRSRIPAPISAQFLTHRPDCDYRPSSRLSAAGRLPAPSRPPAASRACPHLAARPRGTGRTRSCGHGAWGQCLSLQAYRATDRRSMRWWPSPA